MILNKKFICIPLLPRARVRAMRIQNVCLCVCVCVYVCAMLLHPFIIVFLTMQLRGLLYTRRSYVYMYRRDWLTYFTPCLAALTSSRFALAGHIKTHYTHVYARTLQTHHTWQTTRFAQPDRSINHRQNHDERHKPKIITRLQRLHSMMHVATRVR